MQVKLASQILSALLAMLAVAPGANMKSVLQAKYDAISGAFARKDGTVFDHLFAPKFVLIGTTGRKTDRKQVLSDYDREMQQLSDISWARTLDNLSLSGLTATVTVRGKFRGTQVKPDGKHLFEAVTVDKDTWTRQSGSWMLLKTQVISLDATYDGRKLMHKA